MGERLRQEGKGGGSLFPSHPSLTNHTGANKGGGEAQVLTHLGEDTQSYTHARAQMRPLPPHQGAGQGDREAEHCGFPGRGSNKVSLQTGGRPLPSPSCSIPRVYRCPSALPSHSPTASSFFPAAGDKRKKGTEQKG